MRSSTALRSGHTISCGCLTLSHGESRIREILDTAKIPYQTEVTFSDCIFPDSQGLARFDFYVNNQYLIEYDGIQHFECDNFNKSWNTKEHLVKTQQHDLYKNQWCKNNNIPLIRIPYTHEQNLCLEDLKLETTTFLINQ